MKIKQHAARPPNPPKPIMAKAQAREQTRKKIQSAMDQLVKEGSKLSITAVAKLAQVTPALIHNSYPDIAERVRSLGGKSARDKTTIKNRDLAKEKETNRELREQISELRFDIAKLASHNQALIMELSLARGDGSEKVISIMRKKSQTASARSK